MRSRKLLALLFCLITFPAIAGYMTLLGAGVGSIAPVVSWVSTTDAFPSSSLTYSGPSLSTMFDSTGYLTYAPNNLLTQSNNFSNAAWTSSGVTLTSGQTDPLGGTNAWRLQGTTSTWLLYQSLSNINTNLVSYWVKSNTGSTQKVRLMLAGLPVGGDLNVTTSWTQISRTGVNNGSGSAGIIYDAAGDTVDILIYSAALSAVTYETAPRPGDQVITTASAYYGPRIDYDPNTLAVKGLLDWEARTNLYLQSNDLTNAATSAYGAVRTTDGTLGPNGVSLMAKLTANAGSTAHELFNISPITVVSGTVYTASVFVKKGNHRYVFVTYEVPSGVNGVIAIFDLDNPSAATQTFSTGVGSLVGSSIINQGGGVYRISVTGSVTGAGTSGYFVAGLVGAATGNPTTSTEPVFTAAGTEYGYFFGAQLELGSSASPYIPTAAAAVAVSADVFQFTGAALTALQGSAGSAIVQSTDAPVGSANSIVYIGANGATNFPLYWSNSSTKIRTFNGTTALDTAVSPTFSSPVRAAVAWSAAGRSVVVGGGTVATDANAFTSGGISSAYLGVANGGLQGWLNGHIASFAIYNARLPDATLQAKSVVGASYAANDNGIRYAFADNDNLPVHWRVAL